MNALTLEHPSAAYRGLPSEMPQLVLHERLPRLIHSLKPFLRRQLRDSYRTFRRFFDCSIEDVRGVSTVLTSHHHDRMTIGGRLSVLAMHGDVISVMADDYLAPRFTQCPPARHDQGYLLSDLRLEVRMHPTLLKVTLLSAFHLFRFFFHAIFSRVSYHDCSDTPARSASSRSA